MADRRDPGAPPEAIDAEPVALEIAGGELDLTLDDGVTLTFRLAELERAIAGEQAPATEAEAAA